MGTRVEIYPVMPPVLEETYFKLVEVKVVELVAMQAAAGQL